MDRITGSCLCEAVRFEIVAEPQVVGHCYCIDCRKASGTAHCTHVMVEEEALLVEGEIRFFDKPADSGNVVSRGFCPNCGSAIHSSNSGMPGLAFVRASSLDDPDRISPQMTVYASRAPSWAKLDDELPIFQEMMEGGPPGIGNGK